MDINKKPHNAKLQGFSILNQYSAAVSSLLQNRVIANMNLSFCTIGFCVIPYG